MIAEYIDQNTEQVEQDDAEFDSAIDLNAGFDIRDLLLDETD